ncbi:MAG: enoyl-CoA hydratase/isomerase family protein [Thermomicrobiales bacterium]
MTTPATILTTETNGEVRTITLRRLKFLNAFDSALALEFQAALRTASKDDAIRVIVVTGSGGAFSAGQDIFELADAEQSGGAAAVGRQLRERLCPLIVDIRAIEKPVIARINGVAAGAGLAVALACDFRVASSSASLVMSPIGIGLIPGVGLSMLVPRLAGVGAATELFMLGARISATESQEFGLVHQVVPGDQLHAAVADLARRLIEQPREVLGLTKRALNRSVYAGLEEHLDYECALQELAAGTAEHRMRLARQMRGKAPS